MEKITYKNLRKRIGNAVVKDGGHYFVGRDETGNAFWVEMGNFFDRKTNDTLYYYALEIFLKNGKGAQEWGGVTLLTYSEWLDKEQLHFSITKDLLERWKRKQKQNKGGKE